MSSKTKKPATIKTATGPKFDKDGYSRGPNMKLGRRMPDDFLPPGEFILKKREVDVTVPVDPDNLKRIKQHAKAIKVPYEQILGSLFNAFARGLL